MPPKAASPPAACPSQGCSRCWVALLAATAASSTIPPPRCRGIISALGQKLRQPARDPACWLSLPTCKATGTREAHLSLWTRHPPTRSLARAKGQADCRLGAEQPSCARAATVAAHFRSFFRVSENGAPTHGLGGAPRCSPTRCQKLARSALPSQLDKICTGL